MAKITLFFFFFNIFHVFMRNSLFFQKSIIKNIKRNFSKIFCEGQFRLEVLLFIIIRGNVLFMLKSSQSIQYFLWLWNFVGMTHCTFLIWALVPTNRLQNIIIYPAVKYKRLSRINFVEWINFWPCKMCIVIYIEHGNIVLFL